MQVKQPGGPVQPVGLAVEPQLLRKAVGIDIAIVGQLVGRPAIDVDEQQLLEVFVVGDRRQGHAVAEVDLCPQVDPPSVDVSLIFEREVAGEQVAVAIGVLVPEKVRTGRAAIDFARATEHTVVIEV